MQNGAAAVLCTVSSVSNVKDPRALSPWNYGGPFEKLMYGREMRFKIQNTYWCTAYQRYLSIDLISL